MERNVSYILVLQDTRVHMKTCKYSNTSVFDIASLTENTRLIAAMADRIESIEEEVGQPDSPNLLLHSIKTWSKEIDGE